MVAGRGTNNILLTHAALSALTPLVPVPLVDDLARRSLNRRMLAKLAAHHDVVLTEEALGILAEPSWGFNLGKMGRRMLLWPVKLLARQVLVALKGKAVVDNASSALHRAALFDAAIGKGRGLTSQDARRVRDAVDAVLDGVALANSPVTAGLRRGLTSSRLALSRAFETLQEGFRKGSVEGTIRRVATRLAAAGVLGQLQQGLGREGVQHLAKLERDLFLRLGNP